MKYLTVFDIDRWDREGSDELVLIEKLMEFGLLPNHGTMMCPHGHEKPLVLSRNGEDRFKWRCYASTSNPKKGGRKLCNFGVSLATNTFFAKSHLKFGDICKFVLFWLDNIQLVTIRKYLDISGNHTACDCSSFCREVTYDDLVLNMKAIGGPGKTVEIDESKFGKRKYHRGKRVEGQWVFGGFERESGESFMVPVEKRDTNTLLPIIQKWILTGTTIISDFWKSYDCLSKHGFEHLKVNHSINFKDPETGAHTNSIEGSWAHAKRMMPVSGRRKAFYAG